MNNEEKDINKEGVEVSKEEATRLDENDSQAEAINRLEEDIIRNDAIPETSKDTPGSIGAFPVGAFDTSKD
ncbi:MAG: hypothetical protein WKF91_13880 [Segetibacter sp.]